MKLELVKGDITEIHVDAIVNAANSSLLGGGGVDGAIHRKGGKEILEACRLIRNRQGKCEVGKAVITTAGKLKAKKVIHTVGPVFNEITPIEKLKQDLSNCYRSSLKLAIEYHLKTIALLNISTGIYKFPKEMAADIAIETVKNFDQMESIEKVIFVCFDEHNYEMYKKRLV